MDDASNRIEINLDTRTCLFDKEHLSARVASTAAHAALAASWLKDAGVTIFEITLTIPDALSVIRDLAADRGLLVGAGTVADAASAEACLAAGARFLVSPWVDPALAAPARAAGACLMMGAMTPTEVRAALKAGADVFKICPASSADTGRSPPTVATVRAFSSAAAPIAAGR